MTHKIGTIGEFREWTNKVIRHSAGAKGIPRHWFDSEETARTALSARLADPAAIERFLAEVRGNPATGHMGRDQLTAFTV